MLPFDREKIIIFLHVPPKVLFEAPKGKFLVPPLLGPTIDGPHKKIPLLRDFTQLIQKSIFYKRKKKNTEEFDQKHIQTDKGGNQNPRFVLKVAVHVGTWKMNGPHQCV